MPKNTSPHQKLMDLLAGNLAPIPLPPPPVPPPGIDPIVYSGPQRASRIAFGGVNETSIKLFATKRIRTKPRKYQENFFYRQKRYLEELQQRQTDKKADQTQDTFLPISNRNSKQPVPPKPLSQIAAVRAESQPVPEEIPVPEIQDQPVLPSAAPEPVNDQSLQEEEKNAEEELKLQQEKLEQLYLKLAQRKRPVMQKKDVITTAEKNDNVVASGGPCNETQPDEAEIDELLQFIDNLPEEEEDVEAAQIKQEIEKLKAKIDEKYQKANIYVDPKRADVEKEWRQKPLGSATELGELKQANAPELEESQREYYDIHDIETISQRILREVKERKLRDRQEAPFLQPYVFRGK